MDQRARDRFEQCVTTLHGRLGSRFYFQTYPDKPGVMFGFAEKAINKFPDGAKWRNLPTISFKQAQILEATSQTDAELIDRLHKLLVENIDTTRQHSQERITMSDVEEIARKRVEEILMKRIEELAAQRVKPEEIVKSAVMETLSDASAGRTEALPRTGLQERKKGDVPANKAKYLKEQNALWEDRARQLGITPQYRKDGGLDGRWIFQAQKLWTEHIKTETPS